MNHSNNNQNMKCKGNEWHCFLAATWDENCYKSETKFGKYNQLAWSYKMKFIQMTLFWHRTLMIKCRLWNWSHAEGNRGLLCLLSARLFCATGENSVILYFVLQFDRYLCALWDKAMNDGCFRYDLSEVKTRKLSGPHNYVALVSGMLHCLKV